MVVKRIFFLVMLSLCLPVAAGADDPAQKFEGFNLQGYTDTGAKNWDVKGDRADIQGDTIVLSNVDANQYGEQEINLKAKDGVVQKSTGDIHLEKDVVITTKTGEQLKTDSLDWHKEKDLVTTKAPVELTDDKVKITGVGLEASPGLKTAQMKKDVAIEIQPEATKSEGNPITVTCDGPLEVDQQKSIAILYNNVVVVQEGRTLKTDRMEIYFDPQDKKVQQMVCDGHVVLVQGSNSTQADHAVYDAKAQKVILSGRPKLILITDGENSLSALGKKK